MTPARQCACLMLAAACLAAVSGRAQTEGELGENGPSEAYEPGNPHPYFGSENPWNRRMFGQRPADLFYKRRGQRQLLALLEGDAEQAANWALVRLAADSADQESWFMLAIARAWQDLPDEAWSAAQHAMHAGLPFERFLSGPRELLQPLAALPEFAALRDQLSPRLIHGPMLGDMGADHAQVWVRTVEASKIEVEAVPLDGRSPVRRARFETTAELDFSGTGRIEGLTPDTAYRYRVFVDGVLSSAGSELNFRTFPSVNTPGIHRLAFGGCAGYTPLHEKIWDTIAASRPDALMMLGDNVYLDLPGEPNDFHRYTYAQRQSRPEFRRLVAGTPVYAIWDDHDAGMDDLWLGPYVDRPAWKQANLDFFLMNWSNPPVQDLAWPGLWHKWRIGAVEVFMLDARSYRTNPYETSKTMLGPVQKRWLLEALRNSTATFKIIASPVNWVLGSKEGSRDTWQGFPEERAELFDFLSAHHIEGVVLLSSDRHRSDVWINEREGDYPLTEFGSGYLTNMHTHDTAPDALFSYNAKNAFGLLIIDTTKADPELTCEIRNIDGEVVFTRVLKRSELAR